MIPASSTHRRDLQDMRTNIVIDDELIAEAMKLSGARTKREAVEDSLRLMVQLKRQERIRRARGKLKWVGNLDAMRRD
jgi:Arc/MetJ family transcription regulator